jgi:hypothetical protein
VRQAGNLKMRELYILCLEGGLVCPNGRKIRLAQHFGGFFHEIKVASKKEEVSLQAVCVKNEEIRKIFVLRSKEF